MEGPTDEAGRVAGGDLDEHHRLERRASDLSERLRLALDAGGLGTFEWDVTTGTVVWDERLHVLFGVRPGDFDGTFAAWTSLLHPDDADAVMKALSDALEARGSYVVEHRVVWPDGSVHWLEGRGKAVVGPDGAVTGTIGCAGDVTERVLLEREREAALAAASEAAHIERAGRERLEVLTAINDALAVSETRDELMHNVARAAIPHLGDWCSIFVLPDNGSRIPDVVTAHPDRALLDAARAFEEHFPFDPDGPSGVAHVMRTGRAELRSEIDEAVFDEVAMPPQARDAVRALGAASVMIVPLVKRGRVYGAIRFAASSSARRFSRDDRTLAQAVASRITSTLENRRLAEQQREIATTLQASLLPASLPDIPGLDIAVRYWAAGEASEVGGDFYDVFGVDDHWAAVIGDVCGTGPSAASLTGLARHTIRAVAWFGAGPREVLERLNTAVAASGQHTFCTALYAALHHAGDGFRVELAAGGHPLPIVRRADGTCETVGTPGTLLGLFAASIHPTTVTLEPGDTMVLYTDGVTDVRPPHDLDPDAVRALVGAAAGGAANADEVADRLRDLIEAILPAAARDDDMAILVLRAAPRR